MRPAVNMNLRILLVVLICASCGARTEESNVSKESSTKQWESDPNLHKRNAVMGEVIFDDKPVAGATVTVVQTGQSHPISDVGTYILVLDPDELATDTHELLFRAPGFQDERRTVTIPKNKRVRVDVELKPAK